MSNSQSRFLECGQVINTHGIAGKVKLDSWCDSPEVLASLGKIAISDGKGGFIIKKVISASVQKRFVLAQLEGINTPEEADRLRGTVIYAERDDLPLAPGSFFIADLIGLPVYDYDSGKKYGVISDVFNAGASDIYTVTTESGEKMIPAVDEFVIETDLEKGIAVRPIEGMFD